MRTSVYMDEICLFSFIIYDPALRHTMLSNTLYIHIYIYIYIYIQCELNNYVRQREFNIINVTHCSCHNGGKSMKPIS